MFREYLLTVRVVIEGDRESVPTLRQVAEEALEVLSNDGLQVKLHGVDYRDFETEPPFGGEHAID